MAIWPLNKKKCWKAFFHDQFKKIIKHYKRVGYSMDIMRQYACLIINTITVYSYVFVLNCMTVGQVSDSMTTLTLIAGSVPAICLRLGPPWLN